MTRRDPDTEADLARIRAEMGIVDPEDPRPEMFSELPSNRRNGKKWWQETWGKAIGTVLGGVLLGVVWWTWGLAVAFKAATIEVYGLPPRVQAHDAEIRAIQLKLSSPMPPEQVNALADAIAARMRKSK